MNKTSQIGEPGRYLERRIVRYTELAPCRDAFIDTRSPGSDQKENFTIIGPGVAENPNQFVHITEPHGFNIGGARQPPKCLNSQHSHETVEVFYVHSGDWRFMSGENAEDGEVFMGPGDLISIPTNVFRGFENVGNDSGFLWAVLGGDDPGHVMWAPYVFDMAKDFGLVLLENGTLVDTAKGEIVPEGAMVMRPTSQEQVESVQRVNSDRLEEIVVRNDTARPSALFANVDGVTERVLVGSEPISWPHGFTVTETIVEPGFFLPDHTLEVADVWFVHKGLIEVSLDGESATCSIGDTISMPTGRKRSLRNVGETAAILVQARGGDTLPSVVRY